ncbi:MAG: Sec-independent protein translocase subunit TatA [Actinomycetota bacterium]|nr:Sec-independent protein translocase subunit TatA [Actinomycetota bacterium]
MIADKLKTSYGAIGGIMPVLLLTSGQTILVLLILALLLFGAKRLPDSARALGRSMRIFKSEIKAMEVEDKKEEGEEESPK